MHITVHTDGGARGNPGPAAIGVVIESETSRIHEFGKYIGTTTNNVAEYTGVIEALLWLKANLKHSDSDHNTIEFILDSSLVVNQLNGIFKLKEPRLRELLSHIRILESEIGGNVRYTLVPRYKNQRADEFVNIALGTL
jgi:ribonuclease HI